MLSGVNVPKSKSISIAIVALKSMILGIILSTAYQQSSQKCTNSLETLSKIVKVFYLLGSMLDAFALLYFYCTDQFSRLQYYVFYFFHVLLGIVTIFVSLGQIGTIGSDINCEVAHQYLMSILSLIIVFHITALILMWSHLYNGLKYAHFGSNLVWPLMWFVQPAHCGSNLVGLVAFLHFCMSLVCFGLFLALQCMNKTSFSAKAWRYLTVISLCVMTFCYLVIIIGFLVPDSCNSASFFIKSYQRYGLIELLSPILLLLFLGLEKGDPRQRVMKRHNEVFVKIKQYDINENQQRE